MSVFTQEAKSSSFRSTIATKIYLDMTESRHRRIHTAAATKDELQRRQPVLRLPGTTTPLPVKQSVSAWRRSLCRLLLFPLAAASIRACSLPTRSRLQTALSSLWTVQTVDSTSTSVSAAPLHGQTWFSINPT